MKWMLRKAISILSLFLTLGPASLLCAQATTQPVLADIAPSAVTEKGALLLHLPGIGGYRMCDLQMLNGLRDGGLGANVNEVVYDWTENEPGIRALQAYDRNQREAQKIADMIVTHERTDPSSPIFLTAHSGGCGLAVWALEKLPPEAKVQTVLLIAPALSPTYDLSAALRHVSGKMYAFSSELDTLVLYTGTKMFGTIDGVQAPAAGYSGFVQPKGADPKLYQRLVSCAYKSDWMRYGDYGEHIGGMARPFAAAILEPLLEPKAVATTQATATGDTDDSTH